MADEGSSNTGQEGLRLESTSHLDKPIIHIKFSLKAQIIPQYKFMTVCHFYQSVWLGCPLKRQQRRLRHDGGFGLHYRVE